MLRVGLIGDESSHVGAWAAWLGRHGDAARLAAVVAPTRAWAGAEALRRPKDLLGRVDAVLVMGRDGARHRADAEPCLREGLPTFVDKPFTLDVPDAEALLAGARDGGTRVTSFSALRFAPEVRALAERTQGRVRGVRVSGPTDPASPHGGRAFYAPHALELALELAPGPVTDGSPAARPVDAADGGGVVVACDAGVPVEVRLEGPDAAFRAEVLTEDGTRDRVVIQLGPDYYEPVIRRVMRFLLDGPATVEPAEVLDGVRLLAAARAADQARDR